MKKEYTNGDVAIVWEQEKCIHSAVCVKGLGEVFKPREKPWIQMGAVSSEDIIAQVKQCPSGAISIKEEK
ncbi:MAG: (4Fe-4S)-binding protein [Flavobacteriales bacterium]|nr:(4Fe-4S)-binding protein [Flavobacteriales bacterium]